ncbi:hypothetical protein [Prevotella nigrescens]|uniref:hypothetical protein n=1 Tax=Prevotella nigrescens TaxID=28133 RepID=UPI0028DAFEC0|nr:hypothetical protein [Prevotella nigrescens]
MDFTKHHGHHGMFFRLLGENNADSLVFALRKIDFWGQAAMVVTQDISNVNGIVTGMIGITGIGNDEH